MKKLISNLLVVMLFAGCQPSFKSRDLENIRQSIIDEYQKNDIEVNEVSLVMETRQKVVGFAKIQTIYGEVVKRCEANIAVDLNYIWHCQ